MANQPKQPDELPPEQSVDPEAVSHTEHGIPPDAADDIPKGTPNSDRHQVETTPKDK